MVLLALRLCTSWEEKSGSQCVGHQALGFFSLANLYTDYHAASSSREREPVSSFWICSLCACLGWHSKHVAMRWRNLLLGV